jgi:type 1 glutamine amidotransferase
MKINRSIMRGILFPLLIISLSGGCTNHTKEDLIKVLILSGKNNHEWQKTTPLLERIFNESGLFSAAVTERPDTLTCNELVKYDVLLSNWNSWPDNDFRMTGEWESDFLKYVNGGGGVVFIHAGASSFYGWNEYHQMGIGRWGKDTHHGKLTRGKVYGFNQDNPITKGFRDFFITDEIWEDTEIYPGAQTLAAVTATDEDDRHTITEPALFVNQIGKGRTFYTILGHNERTLLNSGLQTLILRAAQWCAGREVTAELPFELKAPEIQVIDQYTWVESDTSIALRNHSDIIWQFNFNDRFGKPYFNLLNINRSTLPCVAPPDHPWHLGLWFSWKFINGINYWEYLDDFKSEDTGYKSAGITQLQKIKVLKNDDFSTNIRMEVQYHPADSEAIMSENSNIFISPPHNDGSYYIDYDLVFNPLADEVILDRTPVEGEPEGKSWGGYAGLSVRFNQDYTSLQIVTPGDSINRETNWLYMGFNTLAGVKTGMCIFQNMKFTTKTMNWYVINNPEIPFYYFSPAVLFNGRIILKKGEMLHLKYRVWILPGAPKRNQIQTSYDEYMNEFDQ